MKSLRFILLLSLALLTSRELRGQGDTNTLSTNSYFHIRVVDEETGRGVPMVELQTVNGISYFTDSGGNIAFHEPDLMNQQVFFHVSSHGYEYAKDGFGYRGARLKTIAGKKATLKIKRINIAKRLYRITGAGIYQDTKTLGLKPPIALPKINSRVTGCDSVVNAVYRNRLYWFWGDTNRVAYPLGNFQVTGATSVSPDKIDASQGFHLEYFQNQQGFVKSMAPVPGKGPTWIFGAFVAKDAEGKERLFAKYEKIKPPMVAYQRGIVRFNDEKNIFEPFIQFDIEAPVFPSGQTITHVKDDDEKHLYFATPFPLTRVENEIEKIKSTSEYEAYTYFKTGTKIKNKEAPKKGEPIPSLSEAVIDRDKQGKLILKWRKNTQPLSPRLEQRLINQKLIRSDEAITILSPTAYQIRNLKSSKATTKAPTNRKLLLASGSVAWNEYRRKWIMIAVEVWGTSMLGEIWYAESNRLEGPWTNLTKIVTHDNYSFYSPRHHPYFDQKGGQIIYFEGTYTKMFSGTKVATPRYNYNQMMYQLDLADIERRNFQPAK